jgi:general secretion pathway protein A
MYQAYYGFEEKPFTLSPDPKYLFLSSTHREVLGHLLYGIEQGEGFMAISGEVGTGKTTLCRTLLDRLASSCEIAFLFNPMLTPTDLIKAINREFDLSTYGDSRPELLDVLNTFLLEQNAAGRLVLLIIDEAQNLPTETLEQLRLLTNLETETSKLLQIVLIGQPELDETLKAKELRQLRQRIAVWWRMGALEASETREYVRHRLRVAAGADRAIFSDGALALVHRATGGVPRLVNLVCDRALLAGFGEQTTRITPRLVRRVVREIRRAGGPTRNRLRLLGLSAAAVATLAALIWAAWPESAARGPSPDPTPAVAARGAPPATAPAPPRPTLPVSVSEAPPSPLVDGVLDSLLTLQSPRESNGLALAAMLGAWRLAEDGPPNLSFAQLLSALEERGLRVLRIRSPEELARIDLPGLIQLRARDGELRAAVVRHVSAESAQLEAVVPGQVVRVSVADLAERWERAGYAAWLDFEGLPPVLRSGSYGHAVAFLQRALGELGHYAGEVHGSFDDETERAVVAFQEYVGLPPDGTAGPVTQVRLYHALPEYRMPVLASRADRRATP